MSDIELEEMHKDWPDDLKNHPLMRTVVTLKYQICIGSFCCLRALIARLNISASSLLNQYAEAACGRRSTSGSA